MSALPKEKGHKFLLTPIPPQDEAGYSISVETITPEIAKAMLANVSEFQRGSSQSSVERYARAMRNGQWHLSNDAICLTKTGKLLNGKHRGLACIMANIPFRAIVLRGVPEDHFTVLDSGVVRGVATTCRLGGVANAVTSVGIAKMIDLYEEGILSGAARPPIHRRYSADEILGIVKLNPDIQDVAAILTPGRQERLEVRALNLPPRIIGAVLLYARRQDLFKATAWFEGVLNMTSDPPQPCQALRTRLLRQNKGTMVGASSSRHQELWNVFILCAKSWIAMRDDETIGNLRVYPEEAVPDLTT